MPVNIPLAQVWPSGLRTTSGVSWITSTPGVSTADDPQPINATIGVTFNTGSQLKVNNFTVYLRGNENVPVLEGTIENQFEGTLNGYTLSGSESLPPSITTATSPNAFNIQANLAWGNYSGTHGYQITLNNSVNTISYQYSTLISSSILTTTSLASATQYLFLIKLENDTITTTLYPFNPQGYLNAPIFVSAPIKDTSVFYRTPGHVGISANIQDTDADILALRPFHTVFARYESNSFNSRTPVTGAQLYAQNTPSTQLFYPPLAPVTSSDNVTPTVTTDSGRTLSGESFKLIFGHSIATQVLQGFVTNPLTPIGDSVSGITDFNALTVEFDIWIESSALTNTGTPFIGLLVNSQGYGIPLLLPTILPNKWNHGRVTLPINSNETPTIIAQSTNSLLATPISINYVLPTGLYKFALLYQGGTATTVWLDNVQITSRAVSWYARTSQDNPFIRDTATWVPFNDTVNSNNDGVRFDQPGYSLQVGADALQQDAEIYNGYSLVPSYAQLGRVVMNKTSPSIIPTATSVSGPGIWIPTATSLGSDKYTFTCMILGQPGTVFDIEWSWGDGNYAFDQWIAGRANVTRTYQFTPGTPNLGQSYVTAQVTDNFGNKGYGTTIVTI